MHTTFRTDPWSVLLLA